MTREDAIGYECRRKARFTRDIFERVATDSATFTNNVMKFCYSVLARVITALGCF